MALNRFSLLYAQAQCGGCTEITRGIQIVVTAPVVTNTGGTTSGGTTTGGTTTGGTTTGGNTTGGNTTGGNTSSGCTDDVCSFSYTQSGPTDQTWSRSVGGAIESVEIAYSSSNCTEVSYIDISTPGQGVEIATGYFSPEFTGNDTYRFVVNGTPGQYGGNPVNGKYEICYRITYKNDCSQEESEYKCLSITITD